MDFYRVKHILDYHQFADIINKLSFHNLNLNKTMRNIVVINSADLLKIEKRTEILLLATF